MLRLIVILFFVTSSYQQESPKVNPFAPLIKPVIGGKSSFTCQALAGSLPLQISWYKDGREIKEMSSTRIRTSEDVSTLLIDSITSSHSGNYSCVISNRFGADTYSIELKVEGPPNWTIKPENSRIRYGDNGVFKCSASGYPKPKVFWKVMKGSSWISIDQLTDSSLTVNNQQELIIENAKHANKYACHVTNGIEPNLWNEFEVSIEGKVDLIYSYVENLSSV